MEGTPKNDPIEFVFKFDLLVLKYLCHIFFRYVQRYLIFTLIFVNFDPPLCMGSTPKNGPIGFIFKFDLHVILTGVRTKIGSDSYNIAVFILNFVKCKYRGDPKYSLYEMLSPTFYGPIGFIFKLYLIVVLKSICAKFDRDRSTSSI